MSHNGETFLSGSEHENRSLDFKGGTLRYRLLARQLGFTQAINERKYVVTDEADRGFHRVPFETALVKKHPFSVCNCNGNSMFYESGVVRLAKGGLDEHIKKGCTGIRALSMSLLTIFLLLAPVVDSKRSSILSFTSVYLLFYSRSIDHYFDFYIFRTWVFLCLSISAATTPFRYPFFFYHPFSFVPHHTIFQSFLSTGNLFQGLLVSFSGVRICHISLISHMEASAFTTTVHQPIILSLSFFRFPTSHFALPPFFRGVSRPD